MPGELETFFGKMEVHRCMSEQNTCLLQIFISEWNPSLKVFTVFSQLMLTIFLTFVNMWLEALVLATHIMLYFLDSSCKQLI